MVKVWEFNYKTESFTNIGFYPGHTASVNSIKWINSNVFVSAGDSHLILWKLGSGEIGKHHTYGISANDVAIWKYSDKGRTRLVSCGTTEVPNLMIWGEERRKLSVEIKGNPE